MRYLIATLALTLAGCGGVTALEALERARAHHCATISPEQRQAERDAILRVGGDLARLAFQRCLPGEFGYDPVLDP